MKQFKCIAAAILMIVMLTANVAYAATGKVTTINMTNLFDAYNSTKKTWNELKTAKHRLMGSFTAYCLQHKATVPNSESYNMTDMMDNYSAKVKTGLQIIVENGYPFNYGGLPAAQAEYATANAIRFWLSECGDSQFYNMTNLGSFSNSQLRTLAASGTITKKIAVRDASYIPALQFAVELLIKARAQKLMTHEIDLSADNITAERSDNVFTGRTMVSTVNLSGGYTLDQSGLPAGSSVTGYTGKSGDVLVVSITASENTANKTYELVLTGKDDRVRSNMQVFCHNSNQAYQRVMCVRLGSSWYQEYTTKTLTVTTGSYVVPMPDLTVTALTAGSASYEIGSEMTFTATVVNQGTYDAVGSVISLSVNGTAVQRDDLPELEVGQSVDVEFTATAPDSEQTLTVTAFADCYDIVDALRRRILENNPEEMPVPEESTLCRAAQSRKGRYRGTWKGVKRSKVGGLRGLYLWYAIRMGFVRKNGSSSRKTHYLLREDIYKLKKRDRMAALLIKNKIETFDQLHAHRDECRELIAVLAAERGKLWKKDRTEKENARLDVIREQMKTLRLEVRTCEEIEKDSVLLEKKREALRSLETQPQTQRDRRKQNDRTRS